MPRSLSAGLQTHVEGSLLSLATCCLISRQDGINLGFTSLDYDLTISGQLYEAFSAADASAVRASEGTGVDNLDVVGLLTSDRIIDTDILAGLYDGASVSIFQVNYLDLTQGALPLLTGTLGEITEREGQYTAEVRGLTQRLNQQVGQLTSVTCRVRAFGDLECVPATDPNFGIIPAAHQHTRTVLSVTSTLVIVFTDANISNYYRYGRVLFTTGLNTGFQREIKIHTLSGGNATLTLQEAFPYAVSPGDVATLEAGCDRTFGRCQFFGLQANFQGEPHLPGNFIILKRGRR